MERRVRGNSHARCGVGENPELISKDYLSLSELRRTGTGIPVASFTVAVDRDVAKDGKRETDFIDCVAWRTTGEFVAKYFTKGSMIVVDGRLEVRNWDDKDGNKRKSAEVNVDSAYFGEGKKSDAQQNNGYGVPQGGYSAPQGGYGAPAGGYGAPQGGYNAPAGGYAAPAYGQPAAPAPAPAPAYSQPAAPAPAYGQPAAPGYGYQPAAPASDFAMLEDDGAPLPF